MSSSSEDDASVTFPPGNAMPDKPTICYHYCALDKFVKIVRTKTLRLCNLFHMNDAKEVSWFFDIASKRIDDLLAGPEDGEGGSSSSSSGRQQNPLAPLAKLARLIEARRFYHVYAACFSTRKDDLSQWRGYADDGRGVTLGIDLEEVLNRAKQTNCHSLEQVRVNYRRNEAEKEVNEILTQIGDPAGYSSSSSSSGSGSRPRPAIQLFRELARIAPAYKNPKFKYEAEVRLIVRTPVPPEEDLDPSRLDKRWFAGFPSPDDPIWFDLGRTGLVPFTRVELPDSAIRAVGFGPKFGGYENRVALRLFCRKKFPNRQIQFYRSKASYR
jgi:hypothetical protein